MFQMQQSYFGTFIFIQLIVKTFLIPALSQAWESSFSFITEGNVKEEVLCKLIFIEDYRRKLDYTTDQKPTSMEYFIL